MVFPEGKNESLGYGITQGFVFIQSFFFGDDPYCMGDARNPEKQGQKNTDPEMLVHQPHL